MSLLRWYFDSWKQILGGLGSLVAAVLLTGPAVLVALLLILYWGSLPDWLGNASMAVVLGVGVPLAGFFAIVLALGRLVDPFASGARSEPDSARKAKLSRRPATLRDAVGGMISEQNRDFAMQAAIAMLMGLGLLLIVRWIVLLVLRVVAYILSFTSVELPYEAPVWGTWAVLALLAFAAYRKSDPLSSVDTSMRLDSPAAMGTLGVSNPRVYIAANANLLIEPFRLIFESVWLARSIRPERGADLDAAAKLLPRLPTNQSVRVPASQDVVRVLLRCRLIKVDPAKPREFVHLLSEKGKDLLVEIQSRQTPKADTSNQASAPVSDILAP